MAATLYDVLVALHVASAIVGFGAIAISGVYGFVSRDLSDARSMEEARRYFRSEGRVELLVLPVPVFGLAALAVEPHGAGVGQLWATLALVVWLVAAGVLFHVGRPAERQIRAALDAGDPTAAASAAVRLGRAGVVSDVAFAVAFGLMIFQPR